MEKLLVLIHITFNNLYEKLLNYERLALTRFYFQTESLHARERGEQTTFLLWREESSRSLPASNISVRCA